MRRRHQHRAARRTDGEDSTEGVWHDTAEPISDAPTTSPRGRIAVVFSALAAVAAAASVVSTPGGSAASLLSHGRATLPVATS